jgi:hypothetical protein
MSSRWDDDDDLPLAILWRELVHCVGELAAHVGRRLCALLRGSR